MTEETKQIFAQFEKNGVDFKEYAKLVHLEVWTVSALIQIEDNIQELLSNAKLFTNNRKFNGNRILSLMETRDKANYSMVREERSNDLMNDCNFILEVLNLLPSRFESKEDRVKLLSTIKSFKEGK